MQFLCGSGNRKLNAPIADPRLWTVSSSLAQPRSQAVEAFCEARPNDEHRERERQNLQKAVEATEKGHQDKVEPILNTEDMEDMEGWKGQGNEIRRKEHR